MNWTAGDDEDEAAEYDRLIMPKLVVSLEAGDEFLRERVINLPEIVVVGTHNTEDAFTRRLTDYRAINTDEDTVLNYFDELEFHPERIGQFRLRFLHLSLYLRDYTKKLEAARRLQISAKPAD